MAQPPKKQNIQVYVRLRPFSRQEMEGHSQVALEAVGAKEILIRQQHGKKYGFDRVFNMFSKQSEVYAYVCQPMIQEVLMGYNCTVFAYGQTGTGKTYTMEGKLELGMTLQVNEQAGIILRAVTDLYDNLLMNGQEHSVRVSYMELYNEEIFDLLSEESKSLKMYEDQKQKGSVIVSDLEEVMVRNAAEVLNVLHKGAEKRRTAETLMNQKSSRSHAVFTVIVHMRESTDDGEEVLKIGKINFVDLAGSENISRSGAIEKRAREAGSINQSLLTLGRVIKALTEKSLHVPYRESKLTRILQDSLGGKTKTSIIATVSPVLASMEESLSTLDYANRARRITNKPEINQRMSKRFVVRQYTEEIERLQRDLMATRSGNGIVLDPQNYQALLQEHDMRKIELTNRITQIKELEEIRNTLETDFLQCKSSLLETQTQYRNTSEQHKRLLSYVEERGEQLQKQATVLLKVADNSTKNENILIEKLSNAYSVGDITKINVNNILKKQHNYFATRAEELQQLQVQNRKFSEYLLDVTSKKLGINEEHLQTASEEQSYLAQTRQSLEEHFIATMEEAQEALSRCKADGKFDVLETGLKQSLLKLKESVFGVSEDLHKRLEDHRVGVRESLSKVAANLHSVIDNVNETISDVSNMKATIETDYNSKVETINRYREIIEQQQSDADAFNEYVAKYAKREQQRRNALEHSTCDLEKTNKDVYERMNSKVSNVKQREGACIELATENLRLNDVIVKDCDSFDVTVKDFQENSYKLFNSLHENAVEIVTDTVRDAKNNFDSLIGSQETCIGKFGNMMEKSVCDLLDKYETRLVNLKDTLSLESDSLNAFQQKLHDKQEIEERLCTDSNHLFTDIRNTLTDIGDKMIVPQPCGDTPIKQPVRYPRRLVNVVPVNLNSDSDLKEDYSIIEVETDENCDTSNMLA